MRPPVGARGAGAVGGAVGGAGGAGGAGERRLSVYEEAPGFRPGPRAGGAGVAGGGGPGRGWSLEGEACNGTNLERLRHSEEEMAEDEEGEGTVLTRREE